MSDVYRIQTSLSITGNVTRELRAILGSMERVEGHARGVKTHIDSWGGAIRNVLNDVRSLSRAMGRLGGNSRRVSPLQSLMGFSAADATRELNELARAMGRIGRGGRRGPMANPLGFNAAEVAAETTRMNEAMRGIRSGNAGASRSFSSWAGSLERSAAAAERLDRALAGVRTHAPGGSPVRLPGGGGGGGSGGGRRGHRNHYAEEQGRAGAAFIGVGGGVYTAEAALETGIDMQHIAAGMRQTGASDAQIGRARDLAFSGSRANPNLSPLEIFEHINDLRGILGTMDDALNEAPHILGEFAALKAKMGNRGAKGAVKQIYDAVRSAEFANEIQGDDVKKHVNTLIRQAFWFGDKLNPSEYFAAQKGAGQMLNLTEDEFKFGAFAALAQGIGQKAGTQFSTYDAKAAAGLRMTEGGLDEAARIGLLDEKTIKRTDSGHVARGAQFKDADQAAKNPFKYLFDQILPAMKKGGVDIDSDSAVLREFGKIYSDKNAYGFLFEMFKQRRKLIKDWDGVKGTSGDFSKYLQSDPWAALQGTQAQGGSIATALTDPVVPQIIDNLHKLNEALGTVAGFLEKHPVFSATAGAFGLAGVGGVSAAGIAALGMLGAGALPPIAIAVGVGATVTILGSLIPWDKIRESFGFKPREQDRNEAVDPNLKSALDLEKQAKEAQKGVAEGSQQITEKAPPAKSWLDTLAEAIARMGLAAMMAESGVQKMSLSLGGLFGGGSGIQKASFGGGGLDGGLGGSSWGGRALGVGSGTGIGHVASQSERAAFIRKTAAELGINPEVALRVAQSEGFGNYVGDHGKSFGDFQLYTGGGIGNQALAAGINIRDPKNWRAADRFALEVAARKKSWADWHGARRVGIPNGAGFGYHAPPPPVARDRGDKELHVYMDHEKVGRASLRYAFKSGNRPATGANMSDSSEAYPVVG